MIPYDKEQEVLRLLVEYNGNVRRVVLASGISRSTIQKLKRGTYHRPHREKLRGTYQKVLPYRCPGCRAMVVTKPCIACSQMKGLKDG